MVGAWGLMSMGMGMGIHAYVGYTSICMSTWLHGGGVGFIQNTHGYNGPRQHDSKLVKR
jgi:hypothetical protein